MSNKCGVKNNGGVAFWRNHIIQYKKSNASLKSYCEVFNLSVDAFESWRDKILFDKTIVQDAELVEVSLSQASPDFIDLILPNNFALRLRDGFNPNLLKYILSTLNGELYDN